MAFEWLNDSAGYWLVRWLSGMMFSTMLALWLAMVLVD